MLLRRFCDYSERLDLPPRMYVKTRILWLINLDQSGRFLGFVKTEGKGGKNDRGKEFLSPHIEKTSGVRAKLLAENGEYLLGVAREKSKPERVAGRHAAFVEEVRKCAEETKEPTVRAVLAFLDSLDVKKLSLPDDFKPDQLLTFQVDGIRPIELESVQRYWAAKMGQTDGAEGESGRRMECLICGCSCVPVKNVPFKIKRIPGGQTSGMALVSTNAPAFESYGLDEISCAPICSSCAERFSKVVNALIEDPATHLTVGPLVYLFWTKEDVGWSVCSLLSNPEPDEVRALLASAFKGDKRATEIDDKPFYGAAFSASGGRVVVRDWLETTVPNAKENVARYFALQQIVDQDGSEGRPYGLYALAAATVRDAKKELVPNTPRTILHAAIGGGSLPWDLLFQAVRRNRAEQGVTRNRAALIKMVLLSQDKDHPFHPEDSTMVQLDPTDSRPAYLCGRLMAVLESIQRAAIGKTNATITDRFFGTASSAPASVFGRLIRGSQAHLSKLRKERPGTYAALQKKLEEILWSPASKSRLSDFPKLLNLEDQGRFALGYYHQRAADRAAARAFREAKEKPVTPDFTSEDKENTNE